MSSKIKEQEPSDGAPPRSYFSLYTDTVIKLLYSLLRLFERKLVSNNQTHLRTKENAATFLLSG